MIEYLRIKNGKLGPIEAFPDQQLEIRPLTIFIGPQGTGKSLVSQLVYFFRNLPFLVTAHPSSDKDDISDENVLKFVLSNLRSDQRALAVFADPTIDLEWECSDLPKLSFEMIGANRQTKPAPELLDYIARIRRREIIAPARGDAVYVPAERMIYSQAGGGASVWKNIPWPSTLVLFADVMNECAKVFSNWPKGIPETQEGQFIRELGRKALRGEAYLWGETWKWRVRPKVQFDLDMASSGQKANWPLVLLSQVLFDWKAQGLIGDPFSIHVEEPEIHLHPAAHQAITQVLAYLMTQGFQVLITTHSLTTLYTLNNLLSASRLIPPDLEDERLPDSRLRRILPEHVAAYFFSEKGQVEPIHTEVNLAQEGEPERKVTWIDEDRLRVVDEELNREMNRIRSYGVFWGKGQ